MLHVACVFLACYWRTFLCALCAAVQPISALPQSQRATGWWMRKKQQNSCNFFNVQKFLTSDFNKILFRNYSSGNGSHLGGNLSRPEQMNARALCVYFRVALSSEGSIDGEISFTFYEIVYQLSNFCPSSLSVVCLPADQYKYTWGSGTKTLINLADWIYIYFLIKLYLYLYYLTWPITLAILFVYGVMTLQIIHWYYLHEIFSIRKGHTIFVFHSDR